MIKIEDKDERMFRLGMETMAKFSCEHVSQAARAGFKEPKMAHCDRTDIERGACCNACWARRWAEQMRKTLKL